MDRTSLDRGLLAGINAVVRAVFSTSTLDELSEALMRSLGELVPHEKSMVSWVITSESGAVREKRCSETISQQYISLYDNHYARHDYTAWYLDMPEVKSYRDSDLISDDNRVKSPIFTEWVRPMGMFHVGGVIFRYEKARRGDLVLLRAESAGDFSNDELLLLDLVADWIQVWFSRNANHYAGREESSLALLTDREMQIALLVAQTDDGIRDIASSLNIAYGTIRKHMASIYEKLGVNSRIQLSHMMASPACKAIAPPKERTS